jgi:hypothetical protein
MKKRINYFPVILTALNIFLLALLGLQAQEKN